MSAVIVRRPKPTPQQLAFHGAVWAARHTLDLANTYIDDGGFADGAKYLREAAELFERAAKIRFAALTSNTQKEPMK